MVSYHFLSGTTESNFFESSSHGAGQLWSQIADATFFTEKQAPFPLVVIDTNGTFDLTTETTSLALPVYEVSSAVSCDRQYQSNVVDDRCLPMNSHRSIQASQQPQI